MIDLKYKQRIRDFIEGKMAHERQQSRIFRTTPAIIIRENEAEQFIDDLWVHLNDVGVENPEPITGRFEAPSKQERENEQQIH